MIKTPIERDPFALAESLDFANMRPMQPTFIDSLRAAAATLRYGALNLVNSSIEGMQALYDELTSFIAGEVLQISDEFEGIIETSGSHSNLKALELARDATGKTGILTSSLSHSSVRNAAHTLGMDTRIVPVTHDTLETDQAALLDELRKGDIAALVLTAGTTEQGIVENLSPEVREYCMQNNIWIHVDAAFGGFNIGLLPKGQGTEAVRSLLQDTAISSITVDPHKLVGQYDLSVLYAKKNQLESGKSTYLEGASRLRGTSKGAAIPAQVLGVMQNNGVTGMQEAAYGRLVTAQRFAQSLNQKGLKLMSKVTSGVTAIEMSSLEEAQFVQRSIREAGYNIPAPIVVSTDQGERYGIRFVFTTREIDDFLNVMAEFIADLVQCYRSNDYSLAA